MAIYMWMEKPPLCFTANTAGSTAQLTKTGTPTAVSLETSPDRVTWTDYTIGDTITLTNIGDKVYFRNKSETDVMFGADAYNYYQFVMTGSMAASGDTTSLINKNGTTTLAGNYYCFSPLFKNCTGLTTAPELPATILEQDCYHDMFYGCTSLTTAPELPATTLAYSCYFGMFSNCTSLTIPPKIPATTLDYFCCEDMFAYCTSLNALPELPATTLTYQCYARMFLNCSNIKLSTSKTGNYQTAYRIPTTGTGTIGSSSMFAMFSNTGGSWTGAPDINTTYYTSNTVI